MTSGKNDLGKIRTGKKGNLVILSLFLALTLFSGCTQKKKNVLFIIVDDLRPELSCYGAEQIHSPNIDKLAGSGCMFLHSYCNIPVCGASRASLFTGLYPSRSRFYSYKSFINEDAPGEVTMPEYFKNNGYFTCSFGKTIHHLDDALQSWSETPWRADYPNNIHKQEYWRDYRSPENLWTKDSLKPLGAPGPAWEKADVSDDTYYDGKTAEKVVDKLEKLSRSDKPFFLAVGFLKPHLPFNAPAKYWDMYTRDEIKLAPNPFMPENAPKEAWFNSPELRGYANIPNGKTPINDSLAYSLKHGYYACVSYTDAQIGKVMDKLKETGMDKNTIVVLLGDHGWSLGEHTHWTKHTCFYNCLHTPLIVRVPGEKPEKSKRITSYIDIFPSLCELTGLPVPEQLPGKSFAAELNNPEAKEGYIFSRYPNGETIVTGRYTYTEYYTPKGKYLSNMLYDRDKDPMENKNIAGDPAMQETVKQLQNKLRKHISQVNQ